MEHRIVTSAVNLLWIQLEFSISWCINQGYIEKDTRVFFSYKKPCGKRNEFIELSIGNKGSLYKIRAYINKTFKVYFGTKEMAYCSNLQSAIQYLTAHNKT